MLLTVMLGCCFSNAAMSAFHCSRDFPPLSVFSGGQSTTIVVFPVAFASPDLLLEQAVRLSPTVVASASAPTVRDNRVDILRPSFPPGGAAIGVRCECAHCSDGDGVAQYSDQTLQKPCARIWTSISMRPIVLPNRPP